MPLSIRAFFAAALWAVALYPLLLYIIHEQSPVAAVQFATTAAESLRSVVWIVALAGLVAAVLYPPFLPSLRIGLRRLRARLGTDMGPLREAQGRLQHFETAADHQIVGRVLLQQGNLAQAIGHLKRATDIDQQHAASQYHLGLALAKMGDLQGAAQAFAAAVALDEEHAFGQAMLELGVVFERGGADDRAVEVLQRHDERFGGSRRNWYHRARALRRCGDTEQAGDLLRQAAAAPDPGQPFPLEDQLYRARARVALLRGGSLS